MKFDEIVKPIVPRASSKDICFVFKKCAKMKYERSYNINLKNCKPIPGGYIVSIGGKKYELSYTELNIKNKRLAVEKGPPQLMIADIGKELKKNIWPKVKKLINNCNLSSAPSNYGGHSDKLGPAAKEMVCGSSKERKYGTNKVLGENLELSKLILLSLPKSFILHYPRIHILSGASTGWHRDACRSFIPQAFRITKQYGKSGLLMDKRVCFGSTVFNLEEGIAISMTYNKCKHGELDAGIRFAVFDKNCNYHGSLVKWYDPDKKNEKLLYQRIGKLKNIVLICGTEKKILYANEKKRFEYISDLKVLTPEILQNELRQMKYTINEMATEEKLVLYGNSNSWVRIFPHKYLHKWYGDISCRRVYVISVSLRVGVGGWHVLH